MKQKKKGFTIIELVIVIAVIAILSAVLIPTFAGIIKKSKESVDQQALRQMNMVLATEAIDGEIDSIEDVRKALTEAGFNADSYVPITAGTAFVWDKENNKIVQVTVSGEGEDIIYTNITSSQDTYTKTEAIPLVKPEWSDPNRLDREDSPRAMVLYGNNSGKELGFVENENTVNLFSFCTTHDLNGENANDPELVAAATEYKDWIADFAIILNDDMKAGSAGICGQYTIRDPFSYSFDWLTMELPEDATAGTTYFLMAQGFQGQFSITYELLLTACKTIDGTRDSFNCGTYNLSEENIGKSITVELRLYETDEVDEYGVRTANYVVCNSTTVEFTCIAD